MGIQANQGRMERHGPFYPDHGLERICDFHDRQDRRYAHTTADLSAETGKPVLVATEMAVTSPDERGRPRHDRTRAVAYCFPSSNRAVTALDAMWRYARWRHTRS